MARRHWHPKDTVDAHWYDKHWALALTPAPESHWAQKHFVGQHWHDTHWLGTEPPLIDVGAAISWTRGGVVPVRYLVGQTRNVVPVETVGAWDIGVVPVKEYVGPANVVPVREAPTETPRVKVVKTQ